MSRPLERNLFSLPHPLSFVNCQFLGSDLLNQIRFDLQEHILELILLIVPNWQPNDSFAIIPYVVIRGQDI